MKVDQEKLVKQIALLSNPAPEEAPSADEAAATPVPMDEEEAETSRDGKYLDLKRACGRNSNPTSGI